LSRWLTSTITMSSAFFSSASRAAAEASVLASIGIAPEDALAGERVNEAIVAVSRDSEQ